MNIHSASGKGLAAALTGGLLLTVDVPLLKLSGGDASTTIVVRGVFLFLALSVYWLIRQRGRRGAAPYINGYTSVAVAVMFAAANIMFMNAIYLTSVANVVFILAFNPMFAAALSWLFGVEPVARHTVVAIIAAVVGVGVIVWDGLSGAGLIGIVLALGVSSMLACSLTLIRVRNADMTLAPAFGSLIAAAAVLPFATPTALSGAGWGWLALNGLLVMPASSALLIIAPRYVAAPVVAMFFLLETVLTPVWMWLVFGEQTSARSLVGGAIVVAALLAHGLWLVRTRPTVAAQA